MLDGSQVGPYNVNDVRGWIQAGYVKKWMTLPGTKGVKIGLK